MCHLSFCHITQFAHPLSKLFRSSQGTLTYWWMVLSATDIIKMVTEDLHIPAIRQDGR